MKLPHLGLLPRIIIAIAAGIGVGMLAPEWLTRCCVTFSGLFSQFLGFLIPLIIIGFVAPAIADIGSRAGRMLVVTAALAYTATLLSGLTSYLICNASFPMLITPTDALDAAPEASGKALEPLFSLNIDPVMGVMTALVLSFMVGLGMAYMEQGRVLKQGFDEFRQIVEKTIRRCVIPLLPWYIFCIFLNMTVAGEVGTVLGAFSKVILIIFGIHILVLLMQYGIAGAISHRNPLRMLRIILPAYFTALGTQSSAATIPVTLRQTIKMGINPDIAGFTVPLCATIHLSGSTLKIVACAMALMIMEGHPFDAGLMVQFIALLGITMVAAPGIPGGAIMASLGVLASVLGFTDQQNALMIALYIAMDSFGTACNVAGDGALTAIVDRIFRKSSIASRSV